MHRLRQQAKRNSWYGDGSSRNLNPFGKLWVPPASADDTEANVHGLGRAQTHTGATASSTAEAVDSISPIPASSTSHGASTSPLSALQQQTKAEAPVSGKDDAASEKNSMRRPIQHFTIWSQIQNTVLNSPLNLLFLLVPAGFAVNYASKNAIASFAANLVATLPMALLISFATDELKMRTGANLGLLIGATFSNAAALVTSIFLLINSQIRVLQITMIGTLLSSMHLMLGISFFCGGLNKYQQHYNMNTSLIFSKLLLLAMVSIALPTIAHQLAGLSDADVTHVSRGIAFILIVIYAVYLYFQLSSHHEVYDEPSQKSERRKPKSKKGDSLKAMIKTGGLAGQIGATGEQRDGLVHPEDEEEETEGIPMISSTTIAIVLFVCTTLLAFNTAFATDSLQGLLDGTNLTQTFVGIVLLPLIANDFTIVTKAVKDEMDDCVSLTVGKCLQLILLVIPITILLGWILGHDMNLQFDAFEVVALFASVLYINAMIQSGSSNYLDGALLLGIFLIICLLAYYIS